MTATTASALDGAIENLRSWLDAGHRTPQEIRATVYRLGLAWPHFPTGAGGLGLDPVTGVAVTARLSAEFGLPAVPARSVIACGMAAPTLVAHGGGHHHPLLRRIYVDQEIWCQLFSEPSAGSDLANVATTARRDGDRWVVNGAKVWTSLAHEAQWAMLLARTDPDAPKHRGLTYFIVRLDAPGVSVRPLFQITGEAEFNEVLLDDVVIPDSDRLGGVGDGWSVAITTLTSERGALSNVARPGGNAVDRAVRLWHQCEHRNPVDQVRLADLWIRDRLVTATLNRTADDPTGSTGPMHKVLSAELHQDVAEFTAGLLGRGALEYPRGYPMTRPDTSAEAEHDLLYDYLRSRGSSIEGGTSEILRNIIGERILGLEPEPRVDKAVPWRETRRG
ncbi:acyl-CoA dehydrogenase family protein [Actinomadura sp. 7K507]|uniref:acyl-CoA dehydrogenase family protein n=1 Tax=Actinomadura sp. 7K507 TaxID=2530365 RepID=UPI00104DD5FF|nr:acyl-CoA dehydrogenase family protein [Actinomadura sp. 7K507]TDC92991.1 acyl-CoA dehydrogenase [Actinomadura sp. 7K507]